MRASRELNAVLRRALPIGDTCCPQRVVTMREMPLVDGDLGSDGLVNGVKNHNEWRNT